MKKMLLVLVMLVSTVFLSACSRMSAEECRTMNWYSAGQSDAENGQAPRNLAKSIKDCARFEISVDTEGYRKGWQAGLKNYCKPTEAVGFVHGQQGQPLEAINTRAALCSSGGETLETAAYRKGHLDGLKLFCVYDRGYQIGANGEGLPQVCPPNLRGEFEDGWREGVHLFCQNNDHAFNLGRKGAGYPSVCPSNHYSGFYQAYQQGREIKARVDELDREINLTHSDIRSIARHHGLQKVGRTYELGENRSPEARAALYRVHDLVRRIDWLQQQRHQAQSGRY